MQVELIDKKGQKQSAEILEATSTELKKLKEWKFDWVELSKYKGSTIYKIETQDIECLMMIQFIDDDFFEMKNIEVSPKNYGSNERYTNAAEIMIAYGCLLSFELNKGPYQGYLSFISKGELIDYYVERYNAELVFRERMQINPINGLKLIRKYLNIDL